MDLINQDADLQLKLLRSCPVLEDLSIHWYHVEVPFPFDIMIPTLKRLILCLSLVWDYFEGAVSLHKFVVTASNLEYLIIQDDSLVNFVVNGRPLLNEVSLNVGVDISLIKVYCSDFHEFEVSHDEAN
ncbi:hypothetical protein Dsin_007362 [Dipteronia sinensis]|uniref:Uncharacterized protein n=1 Tax=Dipteronia sinensis TaxID=43782 RepID=A0AAE0EIC4_9ROSI|nr:hypothetical protein Dsin_007362 [Dipteronia sinensis]